MHVPSLFAPALPTFLCHCEVLHSCTCDWQARLIPRTNRSPDWLEMTEMVFKKCNGLIHRPAQSKSHRDCHRACHPLTADGCCAISNTWYSYYSCAALLNVRGKTIFVILFCFYFLIYSMFTVCNTKNHKLIQNQIKSEKSSAQIHKCFGFFWN